MQEKQRIAQALHEQLVKVSNEDELSWKEKQRLDPEYREREARAEQRLKEIKEMQQRMEHKQKQMKEEAWRLKRSIRTGLVPPPYDVEEDDEDELWRRHGGDLWVALLPGFARGRKKEGPQQRIGQDNRMGLMGWAIISTLAMEILYQEGYCTVFKACISGEEVKFVGYVFVDDDNKAITAKDLTDTFKEVVEYMQDGMTLYEGLLRVTGGGLVPDRSWCYLLDFA